MMARANPDFALRPLLPADVPLLADIFRASIAELTADDYSEAQQEAWASAADDVGEFGARLQNALTVLATLDGSPIGFAALAGGDKIDLLYVHPAVAGRGVGTMLCEALEKLAQARGIRRLTTDASDTARLFFERRGFSAEQRNTVMCGGEWIPNTTMRKDLTGQAAR